MSSRKGKAIVKPAMERANVSTSDESSGSSSQRKSSRLSSQGLLRQATMANFLKNPIKESPGTLFKGLSKKPLENNLSAVQSDETMILPAIPMPTQKPSVLEKSRAKRKSIHEESFFHPSQKALVQSPVAKKKSSSSSVASSVFSAEDMRGDALQKFLKHPKAVGRFAAKRKTKESIEAEMFGKRIPVVELVPFDRAPVDPVVEEEPELEFTVNSSDLDHIEIVGSQASVVSEKTKVYENLPGDSSVGTVGSDRDTGRGEKMSATTSRMQSRTNQMSGKSQSRKMDSSTSVNRSRSYGVNDLPQMESTSSRSSSARISKRLSSRPSVVSRRENESGGESLRDSHRASDLRAQPREVSSKKVAPSSTETLSERSRSRSQEIDPPSDAVPGTSASGSMRARSGVSKRRSDSAGSPVPRAKKRALPASEVSRDVSDPSTGSPMSSRRRLELSDGSPRRQSSRSTPSVYRLSAPSTRRPVTEAGEAENNRTEPTLLTNSFGEEDVEETSRANHMGSSTPRLPFTPKLPPKNATPKSDWRNRARAVVDTRASERPGVAAKGANGKAARAKPRTVVKPSIPRKLTHSVFKFFADTKVSREALEEVEQVAEEFWDNVVEDLKVYATHAGRNTIERSDVELMMRRQRFVTDKISLNSLIEKYMVLEDREKLILVARSGNRLV